MVLRRNKTLIFELQPGVRWWFAFCDAQSLVISKFTKKGYQHVFAFTEIDNVVLCVEPLLGAVNITVTPEKARDLMLSCHKLGMKIVYFRQPPAPDRLKMRSPFITCASYLAYTVGFPFFGFTAFQLYKALIRAGAEPLDFPALDISENP